ncbi:MAG: hypothetical protein IJE07_12250 [Clostridia bacterium]|nr:hypothetical protein [Clostridia bacterium]
MTEFAIRIAGQVAAVSAMFDSTRTYCAAYLCEDAPDFAVSISAEDIRFEREKSEREDRLEGIPPRHFPDAYLETTAVQRKIAEHLFDHDTLLFHGSVVAVDGVAYLFTARSGTGKSTHTRLWREVLGDRAVMINDDKPFLHMGDTGVTAYGSPWNGKHGLGSNVSAPLRAICILRRGAENRIRPIPAGEAVDMLIQQSNRPLNRQRMLHYMELLDRLAQQVVFYELECNMEREAAVIAYETMAGIRKDENA